MDEEYEDEFHYFGFSMKPSDYWRRQGHTTFQHEALVADFLPLVGEDNVMWGSDYPHPDGIWPDSRKVIERDLGRLSEGTLRKVTCENAGKLYGLMGLKCRRTEMADRRPNHKPGSKVGDREPNLG